MAQLIVGLDIGSHTVRAARLRVGFRSMVLEQLVARRVDDDPWPTIMEAVKGADVVFSALPGDQVSFRQLELPRAATKRLDQILPFELDGEVPFDIDSMVIHHRLLNQTSDRVNVLAVVASHEKVESHLTELAEHAVNPREVVPASLTLTELARVAAPNELVAIVDIGHRRSDITVASRGEFLSARTVSFGGRDVSAALARAFGAPEAVAHEWKHTERYLYEGDLGELSGEQRQAADAVGGAVDRLVREIQQTLIKHEMEDGVTVDRLLLCGGSSRLQGLHEYLSQKLGLPTDYYELPDGVVEGTAGTDLVEGAKAVALALHGAAPRGQRVNLRQGDLAFEGEARAGAGVFVYAIVAVLLIMLAWGFSAYARRASLNEENDLQQQALVNQSKRMLGKQLNNFDELRLLMAKASQVQNEGTSIPEFDAFDVVEQISKRIPAKINHEIDTLDIRSGRVQIQGRVDQRRDADEIESALSQWEDCFVKVQVTRTTPAVRDKRLQYTMDIESRCP